MKNKSWIIVLVLVVLVGGAYIFRNQIKSMFMGSTTNQAPANDNPAAGALPTTVVRDIVSTDTGATKGDILVGFSGMTLYTFDKDTAGVSNCSGSCATLWPPYTTAAAPATLPANVTTLKRADGSIQFAYKGMPVYYYAKDVAPSDVNGDGVGGIWHLIKP